LRTGTAIGFCTSCEH